MRAALAVSLALAALATGCGESQPVYFKGEVEYFTYKGPGNAYRTVSATADVQNLETLVETGRKASISAKTTIFLEIGAVWTQCQIVDENGGVHRFTISSELLVEYRPKG